MKLQGKTAIVTGASRGIGRAVAERFAREGANLVLGCRREGPEIEEVLAACAACGVAALARFGDIARGETSIALRDAAVDELGGVDILVNNAGISSEGLLATLGDDALEAMVATNVLGLTRMARAVVRPMLHKRSGCIINLSSVAATRPTRGNSVYAGTKGFVEAFTRALAAELGRKRIRVNAVAPGVIETAMTRGVLAVAGDAVTERIGLRRIGSPDEVAALVAFLASDEAAYISGAVLPVDGAFAMT